ncbi:uncharacterized protein LOC115795611 [Archocentrus centrarchus]|uniref:uncharacterized protein LOC115795611 n=1 Tax=Archocentrus centrarchus TaxID=63155 RepID=UPI0011E9DB13|nr:uncharacterized protein LOC115795611 [Archocentrus centrarchus]
MLFSVILALLSCTKARGPEHVFVEHGNDLLLAVKRFVGFIKRGDFSWRFNIINIVAKSNYHNSVVFGTYKGRAEIFGQNYSLLLKSVKKSDSGNYIAIITGAQNQRVAEYKVTVQDPVSPVNLTVDSVSSSSDSCNLTVTCSTGDSHISSTFKCDAPNCSHTGKGSMKATDFSTLSVYLQQDFIICNHSNQVSWKYSNEKVNSHCKTHSESESLSGGITICAVKTVVVSVSLIIMVFAVISVHFMQKLKKQK